MREIAKSFGILLCVFAFWAVTYTVLRAEAILPLNQSTGGGGSSSGVTSVAAGTDGVLVNGGFGPATGAVVLDLGNTLTFNTHLSNPGQPITLDGANGVVAVAAGDTLTADLATITTLTATTVVTANITATSAFIDTIWSRSASVPLKILDSQGLEIANEGETASFVSLFTPTANNLTLNVAGTGTFTLDSSDTFIAGAAVITSLGFTTATGTTMVTTNTTASTLFVNTILPRTFGAQSTLRNTAGWLFTDDGGGSTASFIVNGAGTSRLSVAMTGAGFFTISGNDILEANVIQSTTINNTTTVQGNTAGGVLLDGTNGFVAIGAGDTLEADILEPVTTNTTLTIRGKGQGVNFGGSRVQVTQLAGVAGTDTNGATAQRIDGAYQGTPLGTAGQVATVNAGATAWGWVTPSATGVTVNTTGTDYTASTLRLRGAITSSTVFGTTTDVTFRSPGAAVTETVSRTSADVVKYTATSLVVSTSNTTETMILKAVNVSPNKTTSGPAANGRDQSGAFGNNVWAYEYVICKDDYPTSPEAGLWSLSATAPTLPSGYRFFALVHQANTKGSGFVIHTGVNRTVVYQEPATDCRPLSSGSATTNTSIDCSGSIPPQSMLGIFGGLYQNTTSNLDCYFHPVNADLTTNVFIRSQAGSTLLANFFEMATASDQTIKYKNSAGGGQTFLQIQGYRW